MDSPLEEGAGRYGRLLEEGDSWDTPREAEALVALRALLSEGPGEPLGILAEGVLKRAEAGGRGVAICVARLALAAATEEDDRRWALLEESLKLGGKRGYVRPYVEGGEPVRAILQTGLHHLRSPESRAAARDLLRHFESTAEQGEPAPEAAAMIDPLTDRELEVLRELAGGLSNKALARTLFVSLDTVKTHLKNVYAKLGVSNRRDAVIRGRELGLIPGRRDSED
jgi:LuxR family maltose regulon positive regulatory protein